MNKRTVKLTGLLSLLGFGLLFLVPNIPTSQAWGLATHMWITDQVIDNMPAGDWKDAFEFFASDLKSGAITPDVVWQDWANHLYYPVTSSYTAHIATERWYGYIVNNLSIGNWKEGMFAAGVMSHYFADPNIPVHTDANWPGHSALETDINNNLDNFSITIHAPQIISDPRQAVVDAATLSHEYYNDCKALYPTGTIPIPSPLLDNGSFHDIIELQLERAVTGIRDLWYSAIQGLQAPDIPSGAVSYTILIDGGHDNYYYDGQLTNFKSSLEQWGLNVLLDEDGITPSDLLGVDLLVITAPYIDFTLAETNAIADWFVNGTRTNLLVTGYSDFYNQAGFKRSTLNYLMANCTTHLRLNDDQVNNPDGYQLWYCDITQILSPTLTFNMTKDVSSIRMYSTSSLYYTDPGAVTNITFGNPNFYQTDEYLPPATIIYDDTPDEVGGDRIPLMAVEQVGDSRVMVSGTTFFSDFDYPVPDNEVFIENVCEWLLNTSLTELDIYGPTIADVTPNPNPPLDGEPLDISANITDVAGVKNATLHYQIDSGSNQQISMTAVGSIYSAQIPDSQFTIGSNITFYIKAFDQVDNWRSTFPASLKVQANPPTTPVLTDLGETSTTGNFTVSWSESTAVADISHYQLQMSTTADFSVISAEWNVTTTSQDITGLTDGTYYFRVRALDLNDFPSNWSNQESINVEIQQPTTPPPPFNPIWIGIIVGVVIIAIAIVVGSYLVRKK
ncbi:MAG: zinc dependent phospholipase C family protein [Promethearchaeota archaeon]